MGLIILQSGFYGVILRALNGKMNSLRVFSTFFIKVLESLDREYLGRKWDIKTGVNWYLCMSTTQRIMKSIMIRYNRRKRRSSSAPIYSNESQLI